MFTLKVKTMCFCLLACFLPYLCAQMLTSVEVDLIHDDQKEAQTKLTDIKYLLQDELGSNPVKVKTKQNQ